jgi:hypothetical protein
MPAVGAQIKVPTVRKGSTEYRMLDLECNRKQLVIHRCFYNACTAKKYSERQAQQQWPQFPNVTTVRKNKR